MIQCSKCQSTTTRNQRRVTGLYPHWYNDGNGGKLCEPCYKKKTRNSTNWARRLKQQVFTHYFGPDYACVDCGVKNIIVLTMDHEEGGGNKQRIELFGTSHACGVRFYTWLRKSGYPKIKFKCRCANCHMMTEYKRIEAKYKI